VASVGITKPAKGDYEEVVHREPMKGLYRKIVWNKADEVVGAVLMGRVEDIGVINSLIKSRINIPKEKRARMVRSPIKYGDFFSENTGQYLW
jgi:NAD(P)H-nitrite reductase large subunit